MGYSWIFGGDSNHVLTYMHRTSGADKHMCESISVVMLYLLIQKSPTPTEFNANSNLVMVYLALQSLSQRMLSTYKASAAWTITNNVLVSFLSLVLQISITFGDKGFFPHYYFKLLFQGIACDPHPLFMSRGFHLLQRSEFNKFPKPSSFLFSQCFSVDCCYLIPAVISTTSLPNSSFQLRPWVKVARVEVRLCSWTRMAVFLQMQ